MILRAQPKINIPKGIKSKGEISDKCMLEILIIPIIRMAMQTIPTIPNQKAININVNKAGLIFMAISVLPYGFEIDPVIIGKNEFL